MFRLIGVGGSVRGQKHDLSEGKNLVGRGDHSVIKLNFDGISKSHFQITINNDSAIIEDLGSANGTFVNEKLIKNQYLQAGDLISVPGAIFQLVKISNRNLEKSYKKDSEHSGSNLAESFEQVNSGDNTNQLVSIFKTKVMKIIYDLNGSYQWHSIVIFLISLLTFANIFFTIGPVLDDAHRMLVSELKLRAKQYVEEVERTNAVMLSRLQIDNINDLSLRQAESDIQSYLIFDANGRVIRPVDKLNTYINDAFAVGLMSWSKQNDENAGKVYTKSIAEGEIGVGKAIKVLNVETQRENIVGYVAIKFKPVTLTAIAMNNRLAYVQSLIISGFSALLFFACIYYLTTRPLEELAWQVEQSAQGKNPDLKSKYLMSELDPLRKSVTTVLQRLREYAGNADPTWEVEAEAPYHEKLYQLFGLMTNGAIILDSQKNILFLNAKAEELLGLRESMLKGSSLLDTLRDQGLAAQILDVCEKSFMNGGSFKENEYEIKGELYRVTAIASIGNDRDAKGYLVTFNLSREV